MTKRPPALLNLTCGVCSAPAPDHLHFGGENSCTNISLNNLLVSPQATAVTPAEHSSGELSAKGSERTEKMPHRTEEL